MSETPTDNTNVLIINADEDSRTLFDSFFDHIDCKAIYVDNPNLALSEIEENPFSLVVIDICIDDDHVVGGLKKIIDTIDSISKAIPVVAITKKPKKELVSECINMGVKGFLTKPIDKKVLVDRLSRLIDIKTKEAVSEKEGKSADKSENKDDGKKDLVADLIYKLKNDKLDFSAMPQLGYKIIEMLKDDKTPLKKVNEFIEKDPGIYARILKAANSAVFAASKPVYSPKDAIMRIGVKRTMNYILVISSARLFDHPNPAYSKILKETLEHSISTAIWGREIASEIKHPNAENFFAFGLLHDIGKVLLLRILNQLSKQRDLNDPEYLVSLLDQLHTKFGASLMKKWKFPKEFYEVVLCHHEKPDIAKHSKATVITSYANILAEEMENETLKENTAKLINMSHARLVGFRMKKFDKIEKIVQKEKKIMTSLLN